MCYGCLIIYILVSVYIYHLHYFRAKIYNEYIVYTVYSLSAHSIAICLKMYIALYV